MKKIFLITVGIMLVLTINSFSSTKKKTIRNTQQTPQNVAVNFLNGFWKAYEENVDYGSDYDYDHGEETPQNQWIYNNNSVTQRYKDEYRKKILIHAQILSTAYPDCETECAGLPIIGDNGDPYQGPFEATNYDSNTGYVTLKPVPTKIGKMYATERYKIKVIKVNGKWMIDDVISPNEAGYFDF